MKQEPLEKTVIVPVEDILASEVPPELKAEYNTPKFASAVEERYKQEVS